MERKRQEQLGVQRGERQHVFLESLVSRRTPRQRLETERRSQLDKWEVVGKGSDRRGGKGGKGSKGMYQFDTVPENEWDWNGGSSTSPAMFNFEASKLPGPPGLPVTNRFQELVSDDESEDETHLQQQLPCCSPTTTHDEFGMGNKKKILKVSESVDCGARRYGHTSFGIRQVV